MQIRAKWPQVTKNHCGKWSQRKGSTREMIGKCGIRHVKPKWEFATTSTSTKMWSWPWNPHLQEVNHLYNYFGELPLARVFARAHDPWLVVEVWEPRKEKPLGSHFKEWQTKNEANPGHASEPRSLDYLLLLVSFNPFCWVNWSSIPRMNNLRQHTRNMV